jgi:glycosyltransferase involved in cell wall biosynthesis
MPTLSLCMIVRNEAKNLPRSLAPIASLFDESIVVDTGSTDGTVDLARGYGAKVFEICWKKDFAQARNYSIDRASGDWIFWLDADNRIEIEDVRKMRRLIEGEKNRIFWCTEVVEPHGDTLIQKRIFPNHPDFRFQGEIHEQLVHPSEGIRFVMTDIQIYHWGYADRGILRQKGLRNLEILREVLQKNPEDFFAHFNIARCYMNLREFDRALSHLRKVLNNPQTRRENPDVYGYSSIMAQSVLEKMGCFEEGRQILEAFLEENPFFGLGWFYLGKSLCRVGRFSEGIVCFKNFHRLGITIHSLDLPRQKISFESYYWLARAYESLSEKALAREAYLKALTFEPQNHFVYLRLAALSKALGQREEERVFLKKGLDLRTAEIEKGEALPGSERAEKEGLQPAMSL